MWVFPEVSLQCPQLYCEHYLTDEDSAPEKDDRTAGTAVGELGFKGKAEEAQGSFFCPFWPFPSSPLSHRCFCGQRKHSISCVSVSSGFVGVSGSGLGLVFTTCCWTDPWEVSTTLTKLLQTRQMTTDFPVLFRVHGLPGLCHAPSKWLLCLHSSVFLCKQDTLAYLCQRVCKRRAAVKPPFPACPNGVLA